MHYRSFGTAQPLGTKTAAHLPHPTHMNKLNFGLPLATPGAMLRITVQDSDRTSTLLLEGKIAGPWVRELEQSWLAAKSADPHRAVVVNLACVTYIDGAGESLLARMHQQGAKFLARGPMNQAIVDEIVRAGKCALLLLSVALALASHLRSQTAPILRLTLKDAVQLALNQNPQVQIANLTIAQSQEDQTIARAGLLPQASVQAFEQTRRVSVPAEFGFQHFPGFPLPDHIGPYQVYQGGPNFSVPVFDLTLWRHWQASKEAVNAARAQDRGIREQIAALVVSQYLSALRAAADVQAAQSRVELAQALYDQAADLLKNGVGTGIDTLRANVELKSERQRLIESQTQLQTSLFGLSQLLNVDPTREIQLADQVSFFETPTIEVSQSLDAAYANRPEMRALLHQERQGQLQKQEASFARYPNLHFDGYWSEQGLTVANLVPGYTYGFTLSVPLFTGGRIGAETARADLEVRKISAQEQEQRNEIALQVRTAVAQLASARNEVEVANEGIALAREEVVQARDRFQAGVANNIEVITAQDEFARANDNQIVALYRYNQSRADLARATGQMEAVYAK
jgi:outer membrane protein